MIEGKWKTVAIAADNVDKIEPAGEMRLYCREITCEEECKILKVTFYVHENGQCSLTTVTGYLQEDGKTYRTQYQGDNHYVVVKQTPENIVFYSENVDRARRETKLVYVVGYEPLTPEQHQKLVDFAGSKKIPPQNIREVLDIDPCPHIEGKWKTVAITADNVDKIEAGGELRLYCHEITCEEECKILKMTFHIQKANYLEYQGDNHYVVVKQTPENIVFYSENVDRASRETKLVFVVGNAGHTLLNPKQKNKLGEFAMSKDIPPENNREVLDTDTYDTENYVINLKEQPKCYQNLNKWPCIENQMKANKNIKHGKNLHRKLNLPPLENSRLDQKNVLPTHTTRNQNLLDSLYYRCTQSGGDNKYQWNEALENLDVLQQFDMDYANQSTYDEFSDKINSYLPSKLKYFRGLTREKGTKLSKQIPKFDINVQMPHDLSMSNKEKFKYGPSHQKLKQLKTQATKEPLNDPKSVLEVEGKTVCKPDILENLYGTIAFKDFIIEKGYNMPVILQKFFMKKGWNYNSVNTPIPSVLKHHEMIMQKMDDEDDENSGQELD
ncbi:hypothetical protein APTSU1_001816400 [Apodemus speciosus]|uniref:Lipocalin/cytosolic fatty-acid binding domain-containing protein n=1 Tax=Apodemus speciosus TaxID=105296 RepID=A0ABQ0FUL2_APOSI